ncbi:hypothetical protein [Micromonospora sp. NPDC049662]|uniref:hypothetical protein n=1 Tax=Micromonospora sp. NPDC049662 TaxID=3155397 RepID=UPI0034267925
MAGRRIKKGGGRPKQRVLGAQRRMAALIEKLAAAQEPHERIAVAAGYATSAAKEAPTEDAEIAATEAVEFLTALGDRLLNARREDRR